jgi:hypothetical protein
MPSSMLSRPVVSVTLPLASTFIFPFEISVKKPPSARQQLWHNIDTVLRKALCEMKLHSFCHLQGEKVLKTYPFSEPSSPGPDLKELSLSYIPLWLRLSNAPLALESVILRHLENGKTLPPNLLNSKHLTCIALRIQTTSSAVSLNQWLEESPVYPSLRSFSFAVKTNKWYTSDTFLSTKLFPFLSRHTLLTYLDIDTLVDDHLEKFASILQQMKRLEFFGFATKVSDYWKPPNVDNLFGYLRPLLSALPSRLGGLEIGTYYWFTALEVREPCANKETTQTNDRGLLPIEPSSLLSRPCSAVSTPKLLPCSTSLDRFSNIGHEIPT